MFILKISDAWYNVTPLDVKVSLHKTGARLKKKKKVLFERIFSIMPCFLRDYPQTYILIRGHICLYMTKPYDPGNELMFCQNCCCYGNEKVI